LWKGEKVIKRGDLVQTWFDTGAMGATIIYGRVICAGRVNFTVQWESGIRNRVAQSYSHVILARDQECALACLESSAFSRAVEGQRS
jgi:hypothetical protein